MARSRKENEHRLPIHPSHFERIDPDLRGRIFLERGYGEKFGVTDERLAPYVAGMVERDRIVADCDIVLLAKPTEEDIAELRQNQILWGWPHCVQSTEITQLAIDRRLTLIAFEAMNHWTADGGFSLHVFHKNNELAGYSSVLHAMQLIGTTGVYGRRLRAAVIGFGATGRGAVTALTAHGVHDVHILTNRDVTAVASPIHTASITRFEHGPSGLPSDSIAMIEGERVPLGPYLADHDIVVNCVLQNPDEPLIFVTEAGLSAFAPGSLLIDVSCDEGMGFEWAHPTTFSEPLLTVGDHVHYYAVDHSPSLLWDSASWEISEALLPHLRTVLSGPAAWEEDTVVRRAIEIREGVIQNPGILSYQHRSPCFPHPRRTPA